VSYSGPVIWRICLICCSEHELRRRRIRHSGKPRVYFEMPESLVRACIHHKKAMQEMCQNQGQTQGCSTVTGEQRQSSA
jgi:hypothetical protein